MQINVVEYLERGALVACPHKTAIDALMEQAGLTIPTNITFNLSGFQYRIKQTFIILRKIYT